jgi:hypothetical protein
VGDIMNRTILAYSCALALCLMSAAAGRISAAVSDPITEWSVAASSAAAASDMAPLRTPITLALAHVAMFDAISAIEGGRRPGAVGKRVAHPASPYAAAVEAGYRVLLAEFPGQVDSLRSRYEELLGAERDSLQKQRGMAVGADVAGQLLARRANDGRNAVVKYDPSTRPGAWAPTPPGFLPVTTAFLGRVAPFTMHGPSQFRPSGPPRLGSGTWVADYDEVKSLGARDSMTRTPEQTATAMFWEPLAGTVWVPTIRRMAKEQSLDLPSSARFQAAAFAAFADGLIACWDAKFHFEFWRPVTAIQHGDADDNRATAPDAAWEPLAVTPNFPEYPSGHACASAAVAHTIEDFFHRDVVIPARNVVSGDERFYQRAADLVDEVVEGRMLLGLHFRSADEDGAEIGRKIARQIRREWLNVRD